MRAFWTLSTLTIVHDVWPRAQLQGSILCSGHCREWSLDVSFLLRVLFFYILLHLILNQHLSIWLPHSVRVSPAMVLILSVTDLMMLLEGLVMWIWLGVSGQCSVTDALAHTQRWPSLVCFAYHGSDCSPVLLLICFTWLWWLCGLGESVSVRVLLISFNSKSRLMFICISIQRALGKFSKPVMKSCSAVLVGVA